MRFAARITSIVVRLEQSATRLTEDARSRTDVDLPSEPVFQLRLVSSRNKLTLMEDACLRMDVNMRRFAIGESFSAKVSK